MKPMPVRGSAWFSDDQVYRYDLTRQFRRPVKRCVVFICLNPSTATAEINDPTVRRCMGYALDWGFDGLHVLNIFALRSTDPHGLYQTANPVGPDNDWAIRSVISHNPSYQTERLVVCAWGEHGKYRDRAAQVMDIVKKAGVQATALRVNRTGNPSHPLYLPSSLKPVPYGDAHA